MLLNANVYDFGTDAAAWRMPGTDRRDPLGADFWRRVAAICDGAGIDSVFLADGPGLSANPALRPMRMMEPLATLALVLAETRHLGGIATVSTSSNDPEELTLRLLTQHALSGGRSGWNVVTGLSGAIAGDFGFDRSPDRDARYRRAEEFLEIHTRVLRSALTGEDWSYDGEVFACARRPAPRLPASVLALLQDSPPLIVQAGGSAQGRELAARTAEAVFSAEMVKESAQDSYRDLQIRAQRHGRPAPVVLPGIHVVLGSTVAEAEARFDQLVDLGPRDYVRHRFDQMLGVSTADLDPEAEAAPQLDTVIDVPAGGSLGFAASIRSYARAHRVTLRELIRHFSGFGHQLYVGPPEPLADIMEDWYRSRAADGFNILTDANPTGLEALAYGVVPELKRRGAIAPEPSATPFAQRVREQRR